jgi:hypothetical protein
MPYSETDKLQQEVEKLILEIKTLKRPYILQPASWFTMIGLIISIAINFKQSSEVINAKQLAEIQLQQSKLDFARLEVRKDSVSKATKLLEDKNTIAKIQLENNQTRIASMQKEITQFQSSIATLSPSQIQNAIGNIKESLVRISDVNKTTTQDFSPSNTSSAQTFTKDLQTARQKEREGFQNLIAGDYTNSAANFQAAENAYNGYHWVYELARLIRVNKTELYSNPHKRAEIIKLVLDKYSAGAPKDLLDKLRSE